MTSACPTTSSTRSGATVRSVGSSADGLRRLAITRAPKALARRATSVPIPPRPTIIQVVPETSRQSWFLHWWREARSRHSAAPWNSSRTARITNSAMGRLLTWALVTRTPLAASSEKTGAS